MNETNPSISADERDRYQWQMWIDGLGEAGQAKLKATTVLISRIGGVGGTVAYYLAAAGVGRLILAHAGNIKASDLNRQLLMTTEGLGTSRVESARRRLHQLNPLVEVVPVAENLSSENSTALVSQAEICVGCAPLFGERMVMNAACVSLKRPLVDAAMYSLQTQLTTIIPGQSACLACISPETPTTWRREFPVIGAVSGTVAAMAAMEVIKLVCGIGKPLIGRLLLCDLDSMQFRTIETHREESCAVCNTV